MGRAIVWFRQDLRLADQPALAAALAAGLEPVPVYVHAPEEEGGWAPGAASRAWLHESLAALDADLRARGSRLVLLRGPSLEAIGRLVDATNAEAVFWCRRYEPAAIARDAEVKAALRGRGLRAESFNGALLVEPWTVKTGGGTPYKVFTPFWRAASAGLESIPPPLEAPKALPDPGAIPDALGLDDLGLLPTPRWDRSFWRHWTPGETGAAARLSAFLDAPVHRYHDDRNRPDLAGTSALSAHLHFGEISPLQCLEAVRRAGFSGTVAEHAGHFVRELGWREFSYHLLYHFPQTPTVDLNPNFAGFGWKAPDANLLAAWQRGRTGIPIVDAGMRELWSTGWMHNRVRMIVASVLTKNLRYHWRHGAAWFWDTLVDADLANNTQGWQWTAGTGADAAPYFRIFNPVSQGERFDPQGTYVRRWVPELARLPDALVHAPWTDPATTRALAPGYPPQPIVDLRATREAALAAYGALKKPS